MTKKCYLKFLLLAHSSSIMCLLRTFAVCITFACKFLFCQCAENEFAGLSWASRCTSSWLASPCWLHVCKLKIHENAVVYICTLSLRKINRITRHWASEMARVKECIATTHPHNLCFHWKGHNHSFLMMYFLGRYFWHFSTLKLVSFFVTAINLNLIFIQGVITIM